MRGTALQGQGGGGGGQTDGLRGGVRGTVIQAQGGGEGADRWSTWWSEGDSDTGTGRGGGGRQMVYVVE